MQSCIKNVFEVKANCTLIALKLKHYPGKFAIFTLKMCGILYIANSGNPGMTYITKEASSVNMIP